MAILGFFQEVPAVKMKAVHKGPGILALALLMALTASFAAAPEAQAAWGSVGSILSANNGTAGTSWSPTTSAQLDAGNVGVCVLASDETGSGTTDGDNNQHNTPTDAAGNTWIQAIEWANMQSSTAANGGFSQDSGQPFVHTGVDGNNLCITQVGANRVSGSLSYIVEAD